MYAHKDIVYTYNTFSPVRLTAVVDISERFLPQLIIDIIIVVELSDFDYKQISKMVSIRFTHLLHILSSDANSRFCASIDHG